MSSVGRRFAEAIVSRDVEAFRATLGNAVDFKGLTPGPASSAPATDLSAPDRPLGSGV